MRAPTDGGSNRAGGAIEPAKMRRESAADEAFLYPVFAFVEKAISGEIALPLEIGGGDDGGGASDEE